ncbi:MAG: thioredoxin, partial [Pirellulales bacterium]|nr:thioredoxin [Pirellulales bacterium]
MTDHSFSSTSRQPGAAIRFRTATVILTLAVLTTQLADAAGAATPTVEAALGLQPVQPSVEYELVPADAVKDCKVVDLKVPGWSGWEVIGPDGATLRRFADTNADKKVDLWSYFRFGIEVYRDIDQDFNGKADQYRWLNTGGTRWGLDKDEDGKIERWIQISAEEVSAELV